MALTRPPSSKAPIVVLRLRPRAAALRGTTGGADMLKDMRKVSKATRDQVAKR